MNMLLQYPIMENLINLSDLKSAEKELKGRVFTERQLGVWKKKLAGEQLTLTEKTYYYKFIKPKAEAILNLCQVQPFFIHGREQMLPERIPPAQKIIRRLQQKHKGQKILLSGSFLFSPTYKDVDVFIFSKYRKEDYHFKKIQVTFLRESALDSLFFSSLAQVSISNFAPAFKKEFPPKLEDALKTYELLVNEILNKENYQDTLRNFLLLMEYLSKGLILNPRQLYLLRKKFTRTDNLRLISRYFIDGLVLSFSRRELQRLNQEIHGYLQLQEEYKNSTNLPMYIETYKEVIKLAG